MVKMTNSKFRGEANVPEEAVAAWEAKGWKAKKTPIKTTNKKEEKQ